MAKPKGPDFSKNLMFYGDNLGVMRQWLPDESVDLIYLDPPFNSDRSYNVLFRQQSGDEGRAQIKAFDDFWRWSSEDEVLLNELISTGPDRVPEVMAALDGLVGRTDMMSYLVNMAVRLIEMRRILKPSGSIYLHCDQTASHYIKVMMDGVFGAENFLNNVVWLYGLGGSSQRYWPRKHDDILWYSRTKDGHYFDADKVPAQSQRMKGQMKKAPDYWDIPSLNNMSKERLGYPTQKPLALLERIVRSSCPADGVVLDPFCGCGTAVDAAHRLDRKWMGMDISFLAIDLIQTRMFDTFGADVASKYDLVGVPEDVGGAAALFQRSPLDFERWAVSLVDGTPNDTQVGDQGVDGLIRFQLGADPSVGKSVVSVKGGAVGPKDVRDLHGTVLSQKAQMGVLISQRAPTRGMIEAANQCGYFDHALTGRRFPKVQLLTTEQLLSGQRPDMPTPFMPYLQAQKFVPDHPTLPGI